MREIIFEGVQGELKIVFIYVRRIFSKTSKVFSEVYFYKNRGINFQDIPPKSDSFLAISEDVFFEALSFAFSQGY